LCSALVSDEKIAMEHFTDELDVLKRLEEDVATALSDLQAYAISVEIDTDTNDKDSDEGEEAEVKEWTVKEVEDYLKAKKAVAATAAEKAACEATLKEIARLKVEKNALNREYKKKSVALQEKIDAIRAELTTEHCEKMVMQLLYEAFVTELDKYLKTEVDKTVKAVCHLWDKYYVSANELLAERATAEQSLNNFLERLGYIHG